MTALPEVRRRKGLQQQKGSRESYTALQNATDTTSAELTHSMRATRDSASLRESSLGGQSQEVRGQSLLSSSIPTGD